LSTMSAEALHPTEEQIQDKFFSEFLARRSSVRAKNWTGWSLRKGRDHSEVTNFYREFDLAEFYVDGTSLVLAGYEVKGWKKTTKRDKSQKMIEPAFGDGIDQALALLQNGADFASVIYPEPAKTEDKAALKELCDHYARNVGIIYVQNDLKSYFNFRLPTRNPYATMDRKKKMLSSLMTGGNLSDISDLPSWAKQQKY